MTPSSLAAVRVAPADDISLSWGQDQAGMGAYVHALARAAPSDLIANAAFEIAVLQLADRAFPVIAPTGGYCWLTSLTVTYGRAARDEIRRELTGAQGALFGALSLGAETLLRLLRADRCVFPNHALFSTSLYGNWTGDELPAALEALHIAYPDRAILWRSLNQDDNAPLIQRMLTLGATPVPSRIVWRIADTARWARRRDVRDDRKLAAAQGLRIETARSLSDPDCQRILTLYDDLYRAKYSQTNPAYGQALLRAGAESGALTLRLFRNDKDVIEAFAAEHVYQGTLINPLLGYDRSLPPSRGLYRAAMAASGERALAEGLAINFSAGAGAFKRNRGARPALEFTMVFDDHLPAWRRLAYRGLAAALNAMTPALERIAHR